MPREDYYNDGGTNPTRQRDFVLNINEYAYIINKGDGVVKCAVGPLATPLTQQESLLTFNAKTKKFDECSNYEEAKKLFVSAPEGWYIILKNPTRDGSHPELGKQMPAPTSKIEIGKKINIFGPASFALYPGQMAKTIRGHHLRSNQYVLARVYDAEAANGNVGIIAENEDNTETKEVIKDVTAAKYFTGQLIIIKGTDVSFYIPPTGIEVVPIEGTTDQYIRDAVTLERLEYCMLKNENGNKRYVHGPAVVFPEPTEKFITTSDSSPRFRAIELSKISGIYVKVIAEYEENGIKHPLGEELFITGNDQMIYYPRAEHAIIAYDGKFMHHAIAIPNGEGRYVMERETGVIKTVKGPCMLLPDPRTEVVVKRKLTDKQCMLWYPNNNDVLEYNRSLNEKSVEKSLNKGIADIQLNYCANSAFSDASSMDFLESNANIARGTSYTKPRTITLDNKYDGVVSIDVWTGYAINVVSKTGKREVVVGPQTRLLDYDETLEYMSLSTGRPKTTDHMFDTAYLRIENNKVSDLINAQTKDFVNVTIKVSYCVDFLDEYKDKWFSVENYVKYLCDHERSLIKRAAKEYNIEEFYAKTADIVRTVALNLDKNEDDGTPKGRLFKENGMLVKDVEVLSIGVEDAVASMINKHQTEIIAKNLELLSATKRMDIVEKLDEYARKENQLNYVNAQEKLALENKLNLEKLAKQAEIEEKKAEMNKKAKEAQKEIQAIVDELEAKRLERERAEADENLRITREKADIQKKTNEAYATSVKTIIESVGPDLVAALESRANNDMLTTVAQTISPYALAKDESVSDVVNKLLRGTQLENLFNNSDFFNTDD